MASRQAIVTRCRVIDQTDSVSGNFAVDETGDVHWFKRADGSLWLFRRFEACRWRQAPPAGQPPRPLAPALRNEQGFGLTRTAVYRFDNAQNPTRLDIHDTDALFGAGIDGLSARAQLAPGGGEEATDILRRLFPWLSGPRVFRGYVAEVRQLPAGTRCPAPSPYAASGPILLPGPPDLPACVSTRLCAPGASSGADCAVALGSLRPSFDAGYRTVRFGDPGRAERYGGTLVRGTVLDAAGVGPGGRPGGTWRADVCVESVCVQLDRMQRANVYYPSRNLLVTLHYDEAEPSSGWRPS